MIHRLPITVRSTHIDRLGHVNNATYQEYIEWGRFGWFRDSTIPLDDFTYREIAAVVARVEIDYRKEATMDQQLTVETCLTRVGTKSLRFSQRVVHADATTACEAVVVAVIFDTKTRKSRAIPDELRPLLEGLVVDR